MTPRGSRYPGVRTERLSDTTAVAHTRRTEDRPYLCVSHEVEKTMVQPLRLAAGLVAVPLVVYAATQLPKERPVLRAATGAAGVGVSVWSLWILSLIHISEPTRQP
jgi:hypothetical protein